MEEMTPYLDAVFRWAHVVAGITWIGLLYFFNWVNSAFAPTLDADSKRKVMPELLPRTLFWFRWGAAYTWISGVLLLGIRYYHGANSAMWMVDDVTLESLSWQGLSYLVVALTFLGVFVYDILSSTVLKPTTFAFWGGVVIVGGLYWFYREGVPEVSFRGALIHIGAMLGTFMAFNVWFRIWPAQQKIITAIKNGEAPDGNLAAMAGLRSKHNTYMSIPLVFCMLNEHMTIFSDKPWIMLVVLLLGWGICYTLYQKAKTVPGF